MVRAVYWNRTVGPIAGNGTLVSGGDGGPATLASLQEPRGLALQADGSLLIAEYDRVRHVSLLGIISIFAGGGSGGDGGPAVGAALGFPRQLAIYPPTGDVYITTRMGCSIRRVFAGNWTISTVAGGNGCGRSGDGGAAVDAMIGRTGGLAFLSDSFLAFPSIIPLAVFVSSIYVAAI